MYKSKPRPVSIPLRLRSDIKQIIGYMWHDEERHYHETKDSGYPNEARSHIYHVLKRLSAIIGVKHDPYK